MRKRIAFRLLASINLVSAWEWFVVWRMGHLNVGAPIVCAAVAGVFLYASLRRRRLPALPAVGATPKQKAEYNLQRVALLVDAEEIAGGWQVRSGGETFSVYSDFITCKGKGQTCYQSLATMPQAEKTATALLYLHKYPEAWRFWAQNHGHPWSPRTGAPRSEHGATEATLS